MSPLQGPAEDQILEEIFFDEPNFEDAMWNNQTEDAVSDFEGPVDDALEADNLHTKRMQEEIDAEDREAGTGLYAFDTTCEDNDTFYENFFNETHEGGGKPFAVSCNQGHD